MQMKTLVTHFIFFFFSSPFIHFFSFIHHSVKKIVTYSSTMRQQLLFTVISVNFYIMNHLFFFINSISLEVETTLSSN